MNKLKSLRSFLIVTVSVLALFYLSSNTASAASLTSLSDTLSRIKVSEDANHTILFVTPTGVQADTDTITITLDDTGDNFNLTSVAFGDIDLAVDNDGNCDGSWTDKTLAASATTDVWGVNVNTGTDVITLTPPTNATTGEITAGYCVQIQIGTNAGGGTNAINNPGSGNTYLISFAGGFGDTGTLAVDIITDDQVTVTASVDPTLDVTISSTTCALGTLTSSSIQTCNYSVTVSTNATNGYIGTILDNGDLTSGGDTITDANGDVDQGTEEYGVGTSKATQTIVQASSCDDPASDPQPASALTTSAQQFTSASAPVSNDAATLCHAASITGATEAGSYSHIVTIIVTANF